MRPEFACRPPLGIGHQHLEPAIEMHPSSGPSGCILLDVRHTSAKDRAFDKKIGGIADGQRYWLDPKRDYIVMRWDQVMRGENGQEVVTETDTVEQTARSPLGVWYATRIRRKCANRDGKPIGSDQIYQLYVDFTTDLPDSLFEPPAVGRIR